MDGLHTLLVGGGKVGKEKLKAIYQNSPGARVTLVAPQISREIRDMQEHFPALRIINRDFEEKDLEGKDLVILATANRTLNEGIRALARDRHILANVADTPDICDFYLGSVVRKGSLKIAISTNGQSPTVSKRLREVFEETIPEEMEQVLQNLRIIRGTLAGDFTQKVKALNRITSLLVHRADKKEHRSALPRTLVSGLIILLTMAAGYFIWGTRLFQHG